MKIIFPSLALMGLLSLTACGPDEVVTSYGPSAQDDDDSAAPADDDDATDSGDDDDSGAPDGPIDADGDGYSPNPDVDCDDEDPTIYPGAPEICDDGIDQDCDGADLECDDGEFSMLSISATYLSSYPGMTLTVQPVFAADYMGPYWLPGSDTSSSSNSVSSMLEGDYTGLLGLLLNVNVDTDGADGADSWFCEGHYESANLDGSVSVSISLEDDSWDEDDLQTWSPGESWEVSSGCAGLLWFGDVDDIPTGFVN